MIMPGRSCVAGIAIDGAAPCWICAQCAMEFAVWPLCIVAQQVVRGTRERGSKKTKRVAKSSLHERGRSNRRSSDSLCAFHAPKLAQDDTRFLSLRKTTVFALRTLETEHWQARYRIAIPAREKTSTHERAR